MAFTKNPVESTYKTQRLPFVGSHNSRDATGSKDQRYVNCFPESIKNPLNNGKRIYLIKRPGLTTLVNPGNVAVGRGIFYWKARVYSVFGNKLYSGTTLIQTLGTSTGTVGFVAINGPTSYLFVCDGTDGYLITTADVVTQVNPTYSAWTATTALALGVKRRPIVANSLYYEVTTAGTTGAGEPAWPTTVGNTVVDGTVTWTCRGYYGGFPSPHQPTPVFLDGYIFLSQTDTDKIFNCDVDLPASWNPIMFISAEMYPDNIVALGRQNNQLVAFGENSIEFFFDAANVNQSPLARNDGASQQVGCAGFNSTTSFEQNMLFVGESELGGRAVWQIEAFQPKKVSIEWVDRLIDAEGTNLVNCNAFILRQGGHQFYVLNLTTRTVVYDLEEKMWHEWSTNSSGSHAPFSCLFSCDYSGSALMQHTSNGKVYKFDPTSYQDDGTAILVEAVTSLIDFDDNDRKVCHSFVLICDRTSVTSNAFVSYSDNDYVTWSTPRAVDISNRPFLMRLGMFRRRAFKVTYIDNFPFRVEALELYINKHLT